MTDNWEELFNYEGWATGKWLDAIPEDWEEGGTIVDHIRRASEAWYERVTGDAPVAADRRARLESCVRRWTSLMESRGEGEAVTYKNLSGEVFTNKLGEIARHVVNHGTYHRGHLRGIAEREGRAFPETDLIRFFRERDQA